MATLDEAIAAAFAAASRSNAIGQQLDYIGELIGVPRQQATKSTVLATVNLNGNVILPAGSQAADSTDPTEIYETVTDAEEGSGSPSNVTVLMRAVTAGSSTFVSAGQLTDIVTPVTGWNSVTNAADSTVGTDLETDADYRVRQTSLLSNAGAGTIDAIRSAVASVDNVTSVGVLENVTNITNSLGLPPHSFEVLAIGGTVTDIGQAIWDNKPAGVQAYGTTNGSATDDTGATQNVKFSRPTEVPIYVTFVLSTDSTYAGDTAFKESIVTAAAAFFGLGDDIIYAKLYDLAFSVEGVTDVTTLQVGTTASPTGTVNISISDRQIATWDTTNITA